MPIRFFELLDGHAEEAGSLPKVHAVLHEPRCSGVPKGVRRHLDVVPQSRRYLGIEAGGGDGRRKALAHFLDRLPAPLHHRRFRNAAIAPASHVSKETIGEFHGRLALLALAPADRKAMEHPSIEVDMAAPNRRHQCSAANRLRSRAGIHRDRQQSGRDDARLRLRRVAA